MAYPFRLAQGGLERRLTQRFFERLTRVDCGKTDRAPGGVPAFGVNKLHAGIQGVVLGGLGLRPAAPAKPADTVAASSVLFIFFIEKSPST
ncbi:MAG: hypothetical protein ACTHJ1_13825 [Bordetella sp.]|uniref:hypothetical protein n=1 Tax=Bordetella sp. TaxID=28081 RepID=UPI003F7BF0DE